MSKSAAVLRPRVIVRDCAALHSRFRLWLALLAVASVFWIPAAEGAQLEPSPPSIITDHAEPLSESASTPRTARVGAAHWAAITDQRRDVLDISRADVIRILQGRTLDWSELGGTALLIRVYLPRSQVRPVARALGVGLGELRVELVADHRVVQQVAATPGAFALISPEHLALGVLALTVDGHDPYRDPGRASPLKLWRWLPAPRTLAELQRLTTALASHARQFDPVGMALTGELIPVRCANHVLALLDDYDAMFSGVRDSLLAADLTVAPLEHPLTAYAELTPCVETVIFTGSHRVVPAMANAGIDVVFTIGNHMMDCWGGCNGVAALYETLDRLHAAGMVTVGAGESLEAARIPGLVSVQTRSGPVSFAFLGYDIIAPWYHAEDDQPGTAPLEARHLREDIGAARELADHVIVGANWGIEYVSNPVLYQRDLAGIAMEAGASLLIGNHPHWVQAIEHFDNALVAYSFGNFIFDQSWSVQVTQGMLMELGFTNERLLGYRVRPVIIRAHSRELPWRYRPEFVDPAGAGRPIMERIWAATDRLPLRPVAAATIAENQH